MHVTLQLMKMDGIIKHSSIINTILTFKYWLIEAKCLMLFIFPKLRDVHLSISYASNIPKNN